MKSIKIDNLTKYYGTTLALDNVSMNIIPGKIYGLLGRNGAGKTTLLNMMTNKIYPTTGDVFIDGENVKDNDNVLGQIYYMMEMNLFPDYMRVNEGFKWTGEFYPEFDHEYALRISDKFGLNTKKKIKDLSTGYRTIFKAITTMATNAEMMIFDEPVLGLDANHRDMFYKELLTKYAEIENTMIISTHLIEEIAEVLEQTIIIKSGKIIMDKSVEDLLESAYTVSGEAGNVEKYIASKSFTGMETIGKFKSVTVLEEYSERDSNRLSDLNLDVDKAELQKLFIALTNE